MKNKIVLALALLCLLMVQCSKEANKNHSLFEPEEKKNNSNSQQRFNSEQELVIYATKLLNDSNFAVFFKKFALSAYAIHQKVAEAGGKELLNEHSRILKNSPELEDLNDFYNRNGIDIDQMHNSIAEPVAAYLNLLDKNSEFASLTSFEQVQVINMVKDFIVSPNSKTTNKNILAYFIHEVESEISAATGAKLTTEEFVGCIVSGMGGMITGGWSTIKQLYDVITGYNLGLDGITKVIKSAVGTVVRGNLAANLTVTGLCILTAWIF